MSTDPGGNGPSRAGGPVNRGPEPVTLAKAPNRCALEVEGLPLTRCALEVAHDGECVPRCGFGIAALRCVRPFGHDGEHWT